jgi:excinuclease UvrABC ATPase subunit
MRGRYLQHRRLPLDVQRQYRELAESLQTLAPAVWLPVSRRLPIPEEEEEEFDARRVRRTSRLESVDVRLRQLLEGLSRYRLSLQAQLSERYKEFEKRVLQTILFSKKHDRFSSLSFEPPAPEDKEKLVRAFQAAGLLDQQMRKRIDEHFSAAEEALKRMSESEERKTVDFEDIFIIPLIGRTKTMAESARWVEEERDSLFEPLTKFERIISSFLKTKTVRIDEGGNLLIQAESRSKPTIPPEFLSSGEKQILILLTQALLRGDQPIIYVADEPELSLHVQWQEKLLSSLLEVGQQIQVIVATHSPDIVGPFTDKVIDLGAHH